MRTRWAAGCAWAAMAGSAQAGEAPLYRPTPDWIAPAAVPAATGADAPVLLLFDNRRRAEKGRLWSYIDTATRIASAEVLAQAGTVSIPWAPDQGDLIVHRVEIRRAGKAIDLLAAGQRFAVLRREEGLERRELTGLLTATLAVQGLEVGDVLRVAISVTAADPALGGRVQAISPLMVAPFPMGEGRVAVQWPVDEKLEWRVHGQAPAPAARVVGGYNEVTVALPLPKQPEMPADAPPRFAHPPMLEVGGFADWAEVSRAMAPLFATEGLIKPDDALDREVQAIVGAHPDPLARAAAALRLAQDKVRYLMMGMAGGNYVPQPPARTWEARYGDCKAKTLLLLAMLRRMGLEAEAVLASSDGGDLLPQRLPLPAAFDHVLVRATVGGETLWLDGTRAGTRLPDIRDVPAFRHVLPLRAAGAALTPVAARANARPDILVSLDMDESASIDLPSLFTATVSLRGEPAAALGAAIAQADAAQKRDLARAAIAEHLGEAQITEASVRHDPAEGVATIAASGLVTTPWDRSDARARRPLDRAMAALQFQPDRARPAWAAIPVRAVGQGSIAWRTRVRLPDGGRGHVLEGDRALAVRLAGLAVSRTATLADGVLLVDERLDGTGAEIAAADIAAERARVALAKSKPLRVTAPADAVRRWRAAATPASAPAVKRIDAAFGRAIAADPDEVTGYDSRASFRTGVLDRVGALSDLSRAVSLEPSVDRLLRRASLHAGGGRLDLALADADAARALDPGSAAAIGQVIGLRSERGDHASALALAQERIDLGGSDRWAFVMAKADVQADGGDPAAALATLDAAVAEKPGDPALLNARCWIKATHGLQVDTALKDCTKAIELSDDPSAALDSRAMAYFRKERAEDALADLDAALERSPGQAASLFLRGVVHRRAGRTAQGDADLALARALWPRVDAEYVRFGVKP